jgi:hypothetical protein
VDYRVLIYGFRLKFSIVGPTGKTSEFYEKLVKAGEKLKDILNA